MYRIIRSILTILLFQSTTTNAEWLSAVIRIDGLTCSMCSNATEKSIRKLEFVDDVKMDLNSNLAEVTFKTDASVSMEQLAESVYAAGFSVGRLDATFQFTKQESITSDCFWYEDDAYDLINIDKKPFNGPVKFQFLGEKYMSKKEYKMVKKNLSNTCKKELKKSKTLYHITLA